MDYNQFILGGQEVKVVSFIKHLLFISNHTLYQINQYPWMVKLQTKKHKKGKLKSFLCGGTLVASKYIISAAHCFFDDKGVVEESRIKV